MSETEKLIEALNKNTEALTAYASEYCETQEAAVILGFKDTRYVKKLYDLNLLPRYYRENNGFRYKKAECKKIALLLDSKEAGLTDNQKLSLYGGK
ncbi:MAG: hypothetical protein V4721_10415 [Bacteroidota bacterium]